MIVRRFSDHKDQVYDFVESSVNLIMQRLNEQTGKGVSHGLSDQVVEESLFELLAPLSDRYTIDAGAISTVFANVHLPNIVEACRVDAERYLTEDPALENIEEVFYASNGFWATVAYRIANALLKLEIPIIPRAITGMAHSRTGVDIHPGATIHPGLFIDHGTGIAIGCTAVIHENVNLYNGVVLGTRSKPRKKTDEKTSCVKKRHPTIQSNVSLYTNAFIGGDIVIGSGSTIGAYAFVCNDVPINSVVLGKTGSDEPVCPKEINNMLPAKTFEDETREPSVIDLIGDTPVVRIRNITHNPKVKIYAKVEGTNPSGSIKDRIALSLIEEAEASGQLTKGKIILESTSGNTGIGLATVGAAKGYEVVLTMSSAMSEERKMVLRGLGATVIETPPDQGTGGAIAVARQMVKDTPGKYWLARQHSSLDNPLAHYNNTGVEILNQVPSITHFVAGIGTFGTLRGAGQRLREEAGAKIVGLEPMLGRPIQGLRNMQEPNSPELYDESLLDQKMNVIPEDAERYTRLLAEKEGLFVGPSSGAALSGAIRLAATLQSGVIVVIFPDRGEKYLSTNVFQRQTPDEVSDEHVASSTTASSTTAPSGNPLDYMI